MSAPGGPPDTKKNVAPPAQSQNGVTFNAGRNIQGAFATGQRATATATFIEPASASAVDISATLEAVRNCLAGVPGIEPRALTRLVEAKEEAAKPSPVSAEITSLVGQAIQYGTKAAGFADAVEQLAPLVRSVWGWAGEALPEWASRLGLQ
jgi:hypothetical protein